MLEVANFTLNNQEGEKIDFYGALDTSSKGVVIFVYSKANTSGCSKQACGFRDHYDEIKEHGYEVLGLSQDKQAAQASWKKSKNLPFDLLCDEDGSVLKQLGCLSGRSITRSVFIVDKESRACILDRIKISPEASVAAVINMVKGSPESSADATESEKSGEEEEDRKEVEVEEPKRAPPPKPMSKAKPKGQAKASAGRSRQPVEKKSDEDKTTEKKVSAPKRIAAQRAASVDASVVEKKKAASTKKSVKRSEPSGGSDERDCSPQGVKRPKKVTAAASTDDEATVDVTPVSQPVAPPRASSRVTRKGAAAEQAKESKEEARIESKSKSRVKAAGGATARSASTSSLPKRGKKVAN